MKKKFAPIALAIALILIFGISKGVLHIHKFIQNADLKPIDGRVNILLMGIAGGDHDGPDLTDTMLVISFDMQKKSLSMISVPRDTWSDTLKDKVNSAYHYGQKQKTGGGLILSKAIVSDMVGLPIHYGLVFDFAGFKEVIDIIGGVNVHVQIAFTDPEFPIAGRENDPCYACRYETLHFDAGLQFMNGETALKYVRSRHADGDAGTDFARSRRQQEVLLAIKQKVTSKEVFMHPKLYRNIYSSVERASDSDMNFGQLLSIGKIFLGIPDARITRISLEDKFYNPPNYLYGRYVLIPKESFEEIHQYIKTSLY